MALFKNERVGTDPHYLSIVCFVKSVGNHMAQNYAAVDKMGQTERGKTEVRAGTRDKIPTTS